MKQILILILFATSSYKTVASNYYWVGGTGNWSQLSHWATTSGGTTFHTQIPTQSDDVFFDVNSFTQPNQEVALDIVNPKCKNMNWAGVTNTPKLSFNSPNPLDQQLLIFGSLSLVTNMIVPFGPVSFRATTLNNTVALAGHNLNDIVFEGVNGEWTIQDDVNIVGVIWLNAGTLKTNNRSFSLIGFNTQGANNGTLIMGSSIFNINGSWLNFNPNININSGTSTINMIKSYGNIYFEGAGQTYNNLNFTVSTSADPNLPILASISINNIFNGVVNFMGDGKISPGNTFNILVFAPGHTYTILTGNQTTITPSGTIIADGTALLPITITGLNPNLPGVNTIFKSSGSICLNYVIMTNLKASGGANFYANNSVDLGGNNGWVFSNFLPVTSLGIITGSASVCSSTINATYQITPVTGVSNYTWTVPTGAIITSGQGSTSITVDFSNAISGNVSVTGFSGCYPTSVTSSLPVTVGTVSSTPIVTLLANPSTPICPNTSVLFTANINNVGGAVIYDFKVNNIIVQSSTSNIFTSTSLVNGDIVKCTANVSAVACIAAQTANSNTITISANQLVSTAVNITASPQNICAGNVVSFNATPTNGGANPIYQWQVNNINAGTNSPTFTSTTLANNDNVKVIITSNATCLAAPTANSNAIVMSVNQLVHTSVNITASSQNICTGNTVSFNSSPTNGGANPIYQWQVNNINVGTNSSTFTSITLANNDNVKVIITSNAACLAAPIANSNTILMTVNQLGTPTIVINTPTTSICAGTLINFVATATNAGLNPTYSWKKNGVAVGTNSINYSDNSLNNNDVLQCTLTSNAICVSPLQVNSNAINMRLKVKPSPVQFGANIINICKGETKILTAPSGYQFLQWQNLPVSNNQLTFLINQEGIYYLTATDSCGGISSDTVQVTFYNTTKIFLPVDFEICSYEKIKLQSSIVLSNYLWNTNEITPFINISTAGLYWLEGRDANSCVVRDSVIVTQKNCSMVLFVPSAFTPNGDFQNDYLKPKVYGNLISYEFFIYNRYGQLIFNTKDINKGWDGRLNGALQNTGGYVWVCNYQFEGGVASQEKGYFTLIR